MENDKPKKYSTLIRTVCGVLGLAGVAAIAINAYQLGRVEVEFVLFAKLFAAFIFLYVALFGTNPLSFTSNKQ